MRRLFSFYRDWVWPVQRTIVSRQQRCSACILPASAAAINSDGLCVHCQSHEKVQEQEYRFYLGISGEHEYDGVVMLSGGKDSLYLLHELMSRYPIHRFLALTVDNGFMAPEAMRNARKATKRLGVEHMIERVGDDYTRLMREAFLAIKRESCLVADDVDGSQVFKVGVRVSSEFGCPLICGLDPEQCERLSAAQKLVCPLYAWRPSMASIRRSLRGWGYALDSAVTNHTLMPAMCAIDIKAHGYCGFEAGVSVAIRNGLAKRSDWLATFECLEWFATRGLLEREIRKAELLLGLEAGMLK